MCEAFNCPPDVARRQEWTEVQAIFDYRLALAARDLFNQGAKGFEELNKRSELQRILLEMHRAQVGQHVTLDDVMSAMQRDEGED